MKKMFLPFLRMNSNSYINHAAGVYIINSAGIAYYQNEVLYIIIAKGKYSLRLMIYTYGDDIHAYRVMIYHCFRNG